MSATELLQALNADLATAYAQTQQTVVQVNNGRRSGGAGVIWRSDGLIVTNAHVIQSRQPNVVLADGTTLVAEVVALDKKLDLAGLRVNATGLPAIEQGDSRGMDPGDWVMAVGHPWGVKYGATAGAIIAVGRSSESPYQGDLVQVGLHMRPGHSGGALVDNLGPLIGINCMIAGPDVGLAIPNDVVRGFLEKSGLLNTRYDYV